MRCSDVERLLPELIEGIGHSEFQAHLNVCPRCAELVADLKWVANEARSLAESDEPPPRVWINIANQLRSEGIIREPETAPTPTLVLARPRRFSVWWLAPVAAAIIAAGAYQLTHRSAPPVTQQAAQQPAAQTPAAQPAQSASSVQSQSQVAQSSPSVGTRTPARPAASNAQSAPAVAANLPEQLEISPPPSEDDERFLSEVSQGAPTMRATLERQLQAVNAEIRETQEYIKWHPGDLDARQHLMEVYQQKAMLYQMALDRIQ